MKNIDLVEPCCLSVAILFLVAIVSCQQAVSTDDLTHSQDVVSKSVQGDNGTIDSLYNALQNEFRKGVRYVHVTSRECS